MTVTTSTAPPSTTQGVDAQAATGSGEQLRPASSGQAVMQGQPASSEQTVMQGQPASTEQTVMQGQPASREQTAMQGQPASREQTVMQGQPASAKRRLPTAVAQPVSGEITTSKRQRKTKKMNDFLCKSE